MPELNSTGLTPRAWTSGDEVLVINEGGGSDDTIARVNGSIPHTMLAGAVLNNLAATTAPTVNEDSGDGYAVGSRWLWAARGLEWVCVDATATAAVWRVSTSVYPPALTAPRRQSWYMDANANNSLGNASGPWGGRWFLYSNASWSRPVITGENGRAAIRRSSASTLFASITGEGLATSIANIDAGAIWRWKSRVLLRPGSQAAPTASEDYRYNGGFTQDFATLTPTNQAVFAYYQTGGTVVFESRTRRASGTVEVTAGTPPTAGQWLTLEIEVTSANVRFWVDGTLLGTHTTVPTGAVYDCDDWRNIAGTSSRANELAFMSLDVDWGV